MKEFNQDAYPDCARRCRGVRTSHAVEIFELLGGSQKDGLWDGSGMSTAQLSILPATTHYNMTSSPVLVASVTAFLDAPMPE